MSPPVTLESVKAELQSWRQQKSSLRSPIPDVIRQKILSLRGSVSMTRLTTKLGINSMMVKSWAGEPVKSPTKNKSPIFVPLSVSHDSSLDAGHIELRCELPNGQQWQLSGCCNSEQVTAFVHSLYNSGRTQP